MITVADLIPWHRVLPPPEPPAQRPRWCRDCDVKWHGLPACWCCGRTA